jgi:hypothetical protein
MRTGGSRILKINRAVAAPIGELVRLKESRPVTAPCCYYAAATSSPSENVPWAKRSLQLRPRPDCSSIW